MENTGKTIIDNIEDRNENHLNITAYESLGGSSIDYDVFFKAVDVYARAFKELGVQEKDVVTLCTAGTLDTLLNFFALNKIGAVTQLVNPNFFKYDSKKYINQLNSKLLICLDRFYPTLKDSIAKTNVKKIILSSLSEYSSFLYKIIYKSLKIKKSDKIDGVEYIELQDLIKLGNLSTIKIERLPDEIDRPALISYTSGSTGNPKGVLHTNDQVNSMISIYEISNGFGIKAGDRNLVLIPPMYLTSLVHSIITPMAFGITSTLQPIYNPETLYKDLKKYMPVFFIGSKAHYLNLENSKLEKNSCNFVKHPFCGGEASFESLVNRINKINEYLGMPPIIFGYGQTEYGTMVMFSNDIPNRTNESGILLPGVKAKILDLVTGEEVQKGERGELYIQSPAMMKGYVNNDEANKNFFYTDENGETWGRSGDIAQVLYQMDGKDVYIVPGRKSDSFIDENGEAIYLFDIEDVVESVKYVNQAEVVALTIDGKKMPVVHVILDKKAEKFTNEVLEVIDKTIKDKFSNESYIPYAYKVRTSFSTSPLSGKRDSNSLKFETDGYLMFNNEKQLEPIEIFSEESKNENELLRSKIMLKN